MCLQGRGMVNDGKCQTKLGDRSCTPPLYVHAMFATLVHKRQGYYCPAISAILTLLTHNLVDVLSHFLRISSTPSNLTFLNFPFLSIPSLFLHMFVLNSVFTGDSLMHSTHIHLLLIYCSSCLTSHLNNSSYTELTFCFFWYIQFSLSWFGILQLGFRAIYSIRSMDCVHW